MGRAYKEVVDEKTGFLKKVYDPQPEPFWETHTSRYRKNEVSGSAQLSPEERAKIKAKRRKRTRRKSTGWVRVKD
jgi:hypothetical protein